jgi:hypothetical protein
MAHLYGVDCGKYILSKMFRKSERTLLIKDYLKALDIKNNYYYHIRKPWVFGPLLSPQTMLVKSGFDRKFLACKIWEYQTWSFWLIQNALVSLICADSKRLWNNLFENNCLKSFHPYMKSQVLAILKNLWWIKLKHLKDTT